MLGSGAGAEATCHKIVWHVCVRLAMQPYGTRAGEGQPLSLLVRVPQSQEYIDEDYGYLDFAVGVIFGTLSAPAMLHGVSS